MKLRLQIILFIIATLTSCYNRPNTVDKTQATSALPVSEKPPVITLTGITLSPPAATLTPGNVQVYELSGLFSDGTQGSLSNYPTKSRVNWTFSSPVSVSVDSKLFNNPSTSYTSLAGSYKLYLKPVGMSNRNQVITITAIGDFGLGTAAFTAVGSLSVVPASQYSDLQIVQDNITIQQPPGVLPVLYPGGSLHFSVSAAFSDSNDTQSRIDLTDQVAWSVSGTALTLKVVKGSVSIVNSTMSYTPGGIVTITASVMGLSATTQITLGAAKPTSLKITANSNSVLVGSDIILNTQVLYSDGSPPKDPASVSYSINDPNTKSNIADFKTLNGTLQKNILSTVGPGTVNVNVVATVNYFDSSNNQKTEELQGTISVVVIEKNIAASLTKLEVRNQKDKIPYPTSASISLSSNTIQLQAWATFNDEALNTTLGNAALSGVNWDISPESATKGNGILCSISNSGVVSFWGQYPTGISAPTGGIIYKVTATFAGKSSTFTITLTPPTLQSVSVLPSNFTVLAGNSAHFLIKGSYSDGTTRVLDSTYDNVSLSWQGVSSDDRNVAEKALTFPTGQNSSTKDWEVKTKSDLNTGVAVNVLVKASVKDVDLTSTASPLIFNSSFLLNVISLPANQRPNYVTNVTLSLSHQDPLVAVAITPNSGNYYNLTAGKSYVLSGKKTIVSGPTSSSGGGTASSPINFASESPGDLQSIQFYPDGMMTSSPITTTDSTTNITTTNLNITVNKNAYGSVFANVIFKNNDGTFYSTQLSMLVTPISTIKSFTAFLLKGKDSLVTDAIDTLQLVGITSNNGNVIVSEIVDQEVRFPTMDLNLYAKVKGVIFDKLDKNGGCPPAPASCNIPSYTSKKGEIVAGTYSGPVVATVTLINTDKTELVNSFIFNVVTPTKVVTASTTAVVVVPSSSSGTFDDTSGIKLYGTQSDSNGNTSDIDFTSLCASFSTGPQNGLLSSPSNPFSPTSSAGGASVCSNTTKIGTVTYTYDAITSTIKATNDTATKASTPVTVNVVFTYNSTTPVYAPSFTLTFIPKQITGLSFEQTSPDLNLWIGTDLSSLGTFKLVTNDGAAPITISDLDKLTFNPSDCVNSSAATLTAIRFPTNAKMQCTVTANYTYNGSVYPSVTLKTDIVFVINAPLSIQLGEPVELVSSGVSSGSIKNPVSGGIDKSSYDDTVSTHRLYSYHEGMTEPLVASKAYFIFKDSTKLELSEAHYKNLVFKSEAPGDKYIYPSPPPLNNSTGAIKIAYRLYNKYANPSMSYIDSAANVNIPVVNLPQVDTVYNIQVEGVTSAISSILTTFTPKVLINYNDGFTYKVPTNWDLAPSSYPSSIIELSNTAIVNNRASSTPLDIYQMKLKSDALPTAASYDIMWQLGGIADPSHMKKTTVQVEGISKIIGFNVLTSTWDPAGGPPQNKSGTVHAWKTTIVDPNPESDYNKPTENIVDLASPFFKSVDLNCQVNPHTCPFPSVDPTENQTPGSVQIEKVIVKYRGETNNRLVDPSDVFSQSQPSFTGLCKTFYDGGWYVTGIQGKTGFWEFNRDSGSESTGIFKTPLFGLSIAFTTNFMVKTPYGPKGCIVNASDHFASHVNTDKCFKYPNNSNSYINCNQYVTIALGYTVKSSIATTTSQNVLYLYVNFFKTDK